MEAGFLIQRAEERSCTRAANVRTNMREPYKYPQGEVFAWYKLDFRTEGTEVLQV